MGPQQGMPYGAPGYNPRYGYPGQVPPQPGAFPFPGAPDQLFSNPMVANVAMHYGGALMDSGKEIVSREISIPY